MKHRTAAVLTIAVSAGFVLSACGGGGASPVADKTLALWDGFTQYDESSPYGKLLSTCETATGAKVERTADPNTTTKLLQAASTKSTPNLVVLDNPSVSKFADTGLLVDNEVSGLDTSKVLPNILAAGQLKGKTYGSSIGSNTLALFYNKDLFTAAGVKPPTTWDELKAAAAKLTSGDVKGIGFSAVGTEEGTFQFLPFFWGSGAKLDNISSPAAVSAVSLWTDLIKSGSASNANINANQQDIRDQFLAGKLGMMVNGTWQLAALDTAGIHYAVVPIPAKDGGAAPSPLGGEFIEVVPSDDAKQKLSAEFAQCMIKPENLQGWTEGQSYIMPYADAAAAQAKENPALQPWVDAIAVAQGRTSDLGNAYPDTSKALWTALQESLTGSKSPKAALEDATKSITAKK